MLPSDSVETTTSWAVASVALAILGMSFGAAWITVVALKDIASEVGGLRSVPALAGALAWLGSGIGGILMSRIAERVGTRSTVIVGSLMIGLGLSISTFGPPWPYLRTPCQSTSCSSMVYATCATVLCGS